MSQRRSAALKIILCGEYGVGKSSIFRRFVYDTFIENADRKSTLGFDHFEKTFVVDGKEVTLQLWDTGGLERVASVTSSYFKYADGAILVFAYDGWESFSALSQHLIEIVANAEKAKIFLCGNKCDMQQQQQHHHHKGGDFSAGGSTQDHLHNYPHPHQSQEQSTASTSFWDPSGPNDSEVAKFFEENRISENENLFGEFFKISCKTNYQVQFMFEQIAKSLVRNWKNVHMPAPDQFKLNKSHGQQDKSKGSCC